MHEVYTAWRRRVESLFQSTDWRALQHLDCRCCKLSWSSRESTRTIIRRRRPMDSDGMVCSFQADDRKLVPRMWHLDSTEDQFVTCFKLFDLNGGLEHFKQAVNEQRHVLEQMDKPEPKPEELDYESEENDDDENEILIETVANLDSQSVVLI